MTGTPDIAMLTRRLIDASIDDAIIVAIAKRLTALRASDRPEDQAEFCRTVERLMSGHLDGGATESALQLSTRDAP